MPSHTSTKFFAAGKRVFKSKDSGKMFVRRPDGSRTYLRSSGMKVSHMDTGAGKRVVRKHHTSIPYGLKPVKKYMSPRASAYTSMGQLFGMMRRR